MYDDYDFDDSFMDDYDDQFDELDDQVEEINDMYEMESQEIDDYWDREDQDIILSGIYTKEEIVEILEEHNEMRRSQHEDLRNDYEMEMDSLHDDIEQLECDLELASIERDNMLRDIASHVNYNPPRKSSFVSNVITAAAVVHLLKKLF